MPHPILVRNLSPRRAISTPTFQQASVRRGGHSNAPSLCPCFSLKVSQLQWCDPTANSATEFRLSATPAGPAKSTKTTTTSSSSTLLIPPSTPQVSEATLPNSSHRQRVPRSSLLNYFDQLYGLSYCFRNRDNQVQLPTNKK